MSLGIIFQLSTFCPPLFLPIQVKRCLVLCIQILELLQMLKEVDEIIVNKTKRCEKDFNCLKSDKHVCCKVESCVNKAVHFITCSENLYCSYKMSFGKSNLCTCAVRKEKFNKYGV